MSTPTSDSPPVLAERPDAPSSCPASPPSSPNIASSTLSTSKRPRTSTGSAADAPARSQPRVDSPIKRGKHGPQPSDQPSEAKSYDPEQEHASAVQGMLDGASLDISVLEEYSRAVLSRWVSNSFKWERQALWSVLLRLHERAETSGAGAKEEGDDAPQRIAKMQLQLLAKEWDRINVDPERRDHDYVARVSVLFQALSVLLTKITHLPSFLEGDVSHMIFEALNMLDASAASPSYRTDILGTLSVLSSKHIGYFSHLGSETFARMIRLATDGISSGRPSNIEFAAKLIRNVLLDSSFVGSSRHGNILVNQRASILRSIVKVKLSEGFTNVPSLKLLQDTLFAHGPGNSLLSVCTNTASHPPPTSLSRKVLGVVDSNSPRSAPSTGSKVHRSSSLHSASSLSPPSCQHHPYLAFAPTLASFLAAAEHDPPLPPPEQILTAGKKANLPHGPASDRVVRYDHCVSDGTVRRMVVKIGDPSGVTLEEAEAMLLVRRATAIPAPELLAVEVVNQKVFLYTSFVPGAMLDDCWRKLSASSKQRAKDDLRIVRTQLAKLELPPGALVGNFLEPFYTRLCNFDSPLLSPDRPTSTASLLDWMRRALTLPIPHLRNKHRPSLADVPFPPSTALPPLQFTHGDLADRNVLVDPKTGAVTAVLDWTTAGVWPAGFDEEWTWVDCGQGRCGLPEDMLDCLVGALEEGGEPPRAKWVRVFGRVR